MRYTSAIMSLCDAVCTFVMPIGLRFNSSTIYCVITEDVAPVSHRALYCFCVVGSRLIVVELLCTMWPETCTSVKISRTFALYRTVKLSERGNWGNL